MIICMYNFASCRMHSGSGATRQALPEHFYSVYKSPETVTVTTACHLMKRLFAERDSPTINLGSTP